MTAESVAGFAPLLLVLMMLTVLTGAHNARKRGTLLMVGGILNVILNLSLDVLLGIWIGVPGIALASSISQGAVTFLFLVRLTGSEDNVQVRPLMRTLALALLSSAPICIVISALVWGGLVPANTLYAVLLLGVLGLLGVFGYLVTATRAGWKSLARSPCSSRGASFDESRLPKGTDPGPRVQKTVQGPTALGVRDVRAVDDVGELPGREWLNVAGDRQRRDVLEVQHVAGAGGGRPVVREPDVGAVRAVGSSGDAARGVARVDLAAARDHVVVHGDVGNRRAGVPADRQHVAAVQVRVGVGADRVVLEQDVAWRPGSAQSGSMSRMSRDIRSKLLRSICTRLAAMIAMPMRPMDEQSLSWIEMSSDQSTGSVRRLGACDVDAVAPGVADRVVGDLDVLGAEDGHAHLVLDCPSRGVQPGRVVADDREALDRDVRVGAPQREGRVGVRPGVRWPSASRRCPRTSGGGG